MVVIAGLLSSRVAGANVQYTEVDPYLEAGTYASVPTESDFQVHNDESFPTAATPRDTYIPTMVKTLESHSSMGSSSGDAQVSANTTFNQQEIKGDFQASFASSADAKPDSNGGGAAYGVYEMNFTVDVPTPFTLTASVNVTPPDEFATDSGVRALVELGSVPSSGGKPDPLLVGHPGRS